MLFPYIDFHTHTKRYNGSDVIEVISIHPTQTKEKEWFTIGYHPWWTNSILEVKDLQYITKIVQNEPSCLGIGECGLDKLKGAPLSTQEEILHQHFRLALQCKLPIIIHCVQAFHQFIQIRKQYLEVPCVIHSFCRNKQLASQLLDNGCHISMAPSVKMSPNAMETLTYFPLDYLFIETDSSHHHTIIERYSLLSQARNIKESTLKEKLFSNFTQFFAERWKHQNG